MTTTWELSFYLLGGDHPVCVVDDWQCGDVLSTPVCGGFLVQIVSFDMGTGPIENTQSRTRGWSVWHMRVRPLLGRTLIERLSKLYQRALGASNLGPVEIALHIGEMARRGSALVKQMEEINGKELYSKQAQDG